MIRVWLVLSLAFCAGAGAGIVGGDPCWLLNRGVVSHRVLLGHVGLQFPAFGYELHPGHSFLREGFKVSGWRPFVVDVVDREQPAKGVDGNGHSHIGSTDAVEAGFNKSVHAKKKPAGYPSPAGMWTRFNGMTLKPYHGCSGRSSTFGRGLRFFPACHAGPEWRNPRMRVTRLGNSRRFASPRFHPKSTALSNPSTTPLRLNPNKKGTICPLET